MRLSYLLTNVERALIFFWFLLSMGNFAGALLLISPVIAAADKGSKLAAHGTYAAGGFWIASLAGIGVSGFQSQFSSRRLKSLRLATIKGYFVVLVPIRLIFTLVWVFMLLFTDHLREQKFFALACLLDNLLIVRFLIALWTQPKPYAFIGISKPGLTLPRNAQSSHKAQDFVSETKSTAVVEARIQQYGQILEGIRPKQDSLEPPSQMAIAYAKRERCGPEELYTDPEDGGQREYASARSHLDLTAGGIKELRQVRGFLRCACCIESSFTPVSPEYGCDPENGAANADHDDWSRFRQGFLRKSSVGVTTDFVPQLDAVNNVHRLCSTCAKVSARITHHLGVSGRRSKLSRLLHPDRDVISLMHHDKPSTLKESSKTCHLCALIWGSLNGAQQASLLKGDKGTFGSYDDGLHSINSSVHDQRAIRLVILEEMLIPHFGGFKRPRRWEKAVSGFRDESTEAGSEFANPLYLTGPGWGNDYTDYEIMRTILTKRRAGPLSLPVTDHTGSDSVVAWIKHTLQGRRSTSSWLPTRILDVRDLHTEGRILLRHSQDLSEDEHTQFIALSHCWGKLHIPTLLEGDVSERMTRGWKIEELPRTFREAMDVAFNLGISYIWIDSLCIFQDSDEDWDHEASLMASIYREAFCTIAAVDAVNGEGGLFRPQQPTSSGPCLLGMEGDGEDPLYVVPYPQCEDTTLRKELALSTWNSRGWILQERYLSSAVLYFCATQVYIGLGDQLAIEAGEPGLTNWLPSTLSTTSVDSRDISTTRRDTNSEQDDHRLLPVPSPQHRDSVLDEILNIVRPPFDNTKRKQGYLLRGQLETDDFWDYRFRKRHDVAYTKAMRTSFVERRLGTNNTTDPNSLWWAALNEFSMRDLTKNFDKLPAVRGLAVYIHDTYQSNCTDGLDHYVMGMWRNKITTGLLWYVDLASNRPRPETYRAPSWSWASVEGVVSNDSLNMNEDEATIKFIKFDVKGKKTSSLPWLFDACAVGTAITLNGAIALALWSKATSELEKRYYVARSLILHETQDLETPTALQDLFSAVSTVPQAGPLCHELLHPTTGQRVGWLLPDSPEDLPAEIFCFKIQVTPRNPDDQQAIWATRGLVLVRDERDVGDEDHSLRNCYRRVGYFELDCAFQGIRVGSEYSHTAEFTLHGRTSHVARYTEFPIMNKPLMDPHGLFDGREAHDIVIV